MKTSIARLLFSLSIVAGGPALGASAQEATSPLLSALPKRSDLTLSYFTPVQLRPNQVAEVASLLFGDTIKVAPPEGGWVTAAHFIELGNILVIQDTPEMSARIRSTLSELDANAAASTQVATPPETLEYTPRHISIDALLPALDRQVVNLVVSPVEEKRLLLVRGQVGPMAEARRLIAQLDVPSPQVTITCHLIRGLNEGTSSPTLPKELVENLRRILPMTAFELLSVGVLHTSVASSPIQLETVAAPNLSYSLQLQPSAYDAKEGTLTLASCFFQLRTGFTEAANSHELRTHLALRAGEYTVLGALGSDPIFIVLRVVPDRS